MAKRVYLFNEGDKDDRALLGGKGANLCEMTRLNLPVPFGFIVTTSTCQEFFALGNRLPHALEHEYLTALRIVEDRMQAQFGNPDNPLLLSVRSGAPVSMPGMMNTILYLGFNDDIAEGLARKTGNPRFAWDSYRRFLQMYANVVLNVESEAFEKVIEERKARHGKKLDTDLAAEDWQEVVGRFKQLARIPQDPQEQLREAMKSVFLSWNTPRARIYREINNIDGNLGTAVTVQSMVFGNFSEDSGSGVAFTRNPSTGEATFFGEILFNAAGEDVVAGIRTPLPLSAMQDRLPDIYRQLHDIQASLEAHYRDMQDIEFTIQEGRLYLLQTRSGKRTGRAAIKIAVDMVRQGMITETEALLRIEPSHVESFLHPMIDPDVERQVIARGLAASPGASRGKAVFSADEAVEFAKQGEKTILIRRETTPEDIHGMRVTEGILTELGGMTSHAAVVARGMGVCAITGCSSLRVDAAAGIALALNDAGKDVEIKRGDVVTLDGTNGDVILGTVNTIAASADSDFQQLLAWADKYRKLKVRANAETPEDATNAREMGAEGIGLCRTEHMFFAADRIDVMRAMILADTEAERQQHLDRLYDFQFEDIKSLFTIMDGQPVNIRLLDPPLHEFLPHDEAGAREIAKQLGKSASDVIEKVQQLKEVNPMLGFRGCRLTVIYPEITEMQVKAILSAAAAVIQEGIEAKPEIMIPLVINVREVRLVTDIIEKITHELFLQKRLSLPYKVGTMMETPRACLGAGRIAPEVEFMSFGTNDLTQMTYGFSRDDAGKFIPEYLDQNLIAADPFVSLDTRAVGKLLEMAIKDSRRVNARIKYGICGEHGGDPESIEFCHHAGLDYVSCSPFRVPVARLAAAKAAVIR